MKSSNRTDHRVATYRPLENFNDLTEDERAEIILAALDLGGYGEGFFSVENTIIIARAIGDTHEKTS